MNRKSYRPKKEFKHRQNNLLYGNLNYNGQFTHSTQIRLTSFDGQHCESREVDDAATLRLSDDCNHWIHLSGLSDEPAVEALCRRLGLELPMIQDILNARHIAKVEDAGSVLFAVSDAYSYGQDGELQREHQSIVLGRNYVFSFEEGPGHRFDVVAKALQDNIGKVRQHGADYLFNLLVSLVVDSYFDVLEIQQDRLLDIEEQLMEFTSTHRVTGQDIQRLRRDHVRLQKAVTPLREGFGHLLMLEPDLIASDNRMYLRDTYDHLQQVVSMLDANRELLSSLMDLYLANNDLRMNLVMKQLTVVATVFIPLTFLVGVWGMNFEHMPELGLKHGYLYAWSVMVVMGLLLYGWFRKKYNR